MGFIGKCNQFGIGSASPIRRAGPYNITNYQNKRAPDDGPEPEEKTCEVWCGGGGGVGDKTSSASSSSTAKETVPRTLVAGQGIDCTINTIK